MENLIYGVNILRIFVKKFVLFYFMEKIGDIVFEFNCFMINLICWFIFGWLFLIKYCRIFFIFYSKSY